jgi:hypothetical protein
LFFQIGKTNQNGIDRKPRGRKRKMKRLIVLAAAIMLMVTCGCATYYKVTDPSSGKVYYTDDVDREGASIIFKDVKTQSTVTLQNSEIIEVSKDEFKAKTMGK